MVAVVLVIIMNMQLAGSALQAYLSLVNYGDLHVHWRPKQCIVTDLLEVF